MGASPKAAWDTSVGAALLEVLQGVTRQEVDDSTPATATVGDRDARHLILALTLTLTLQQAELEMVIQSSDDRDARHHAD